MDGRRAAADNLLIARLAQEGVEIRPEHRFARVLTGFSAPLNPSAVALLEHAPEVAGVYPVRIAYPASASSTLIEKGRLAAGVGVATERLSPGLRRKRRDDRPPRHGSRGDASVPARPGRRRVRRRRLRPRCRREREPRGPDPSRAARDADGGADGRLGRARRLERDRAAARRSFRSGSRAGSAKRAGVGGLRPDRPARRGARTGGRSEWRRRRARRGEGRARGSRGAFRSLRGQPLGPRRRRRPSARHARRRAGRKRRRGRPRVRQHLRAGWLTRRAHGRCGGPSRVLRVRPCRIRSGLGVSFDQRVPLVGAVAPRGSLALGLAAPRLERTAIRSTSPSSATSSTREASAT